jgi:uncharacterized protein
VSRNLADSADGGVKSDGVEKSESTSTKPMDQGPLTDKELEDLDNFLLNADLENSMDVSMLDGFLTAVVSGPTLILPSQWLPWVWDCEEGKQSIRFKSAKQAQRITGLILKHMNDLTSTLVRYADEYEPVLMENPNEGDPIPIIDEWCCGYMKGVMLDYAGWLPLLTAADKPLHSIWLYGTPDGWEQLSQQAPNLEQHRCTADGLADVARLAHAYWLARRLVR